MGMYDTFLIDDKCPCCGEPIKDIQSKAFACEMYKYHLGDEIVFDKGLGFYMEKGYTVENLYCDHCKECLRSYVAKVNIVDSKFDSYEFVLIY